MAANEDRYLDYQVHGSGVSSLPAGMAHLAMTTVRQRAAQSLVAEILARNGGEQFVWYAPRVTPELCCYWGGASTNLLWITNVGVHIKRGGPVVPLARATTWEKQDGDYIGWLLPGAEAGSGGGAKRSEVVEVRCPESGLLEPIGVICAICDVVHS